MIGRLRLAAAAAYPAILVPDTAIATDATRRVVYTVDPKGTVMVKPVGAWSFDREPAGDPKRPLGAGQRHYRWNSVPHAWPEGEAEEGPDPGANDNTSRTCVQLNLLQPQPRTPVGAAG